MTLTAFPITSAGRFWPRGPLGIAKTLFGGHLLNCFLQAFDLAFDCPYVRLSHIDSLPAGQRLTDEYLSLFEGARLSA
jgi:hypothetical protein